MGEAVPGRILEARCAPVDELSDEREGPKGLPPDPGYPEEGAEILGLRLVGLDEDPPEPLRCDVGDQNGVPAG